MRKEKMNLNIVLVNKIYIFLQTVFLYLVRLTVYYQYVQAYSKCKVAHIQHNMVGPVFYK